MLWQSRVGSVRFQGVDTLATFLLSEERPSTSEVGCFGILVAPGPVMLNRVTIILVLSLAPATAQDILPFLQSQLEAGKSSVTLRGLVAALKAVCVGE